SLVFYAVTSVGMAAFLSACSGDAAPEFSLDPWAYGRALPKEPQTEGDAERGREILLNGSYMSCGVPWKLWENELTGPVVRSTLGSNGSIGVEGRIGRNATDRKSTRLNSS